MTKPAKAKADEKKDERHPHQTPGSIGELHGQLTAFMASPWCDASDANFDYALMSGGFGGGPPIVRNLQTGKSFTLSAEDVIKLAKHAGIDIPEEGYVPSPRRKKAEPEEPKKRKGGKRG